MGLLDSILGNMTGAGGASMQGRGGATSPIMKALMMLLAAKAFQHYRSGSQGGSMSGGLGDILSRFQRGGQRMLSVIPSCGLVRDADHGR
jgi:hypothetical protein